MLPIISTFIVVASIFFLFFWFFIFRKEAEARLKHGWVEVQGADTVVTNQS